MDNKINNTSKFAVGDLVILKGFEEVESVGFVIGVQKSTQQVKYRIHWFQIVESHPYWYDENDLIPKG